MQRQLHPFLSSVIPEGLFSILCHHYSTMNKKGNGKNLAVRFLFCPW